MHSVLIYCSQSKSSTGNKFDFRISYKVLPRENAVVRFGGVTGNISNGNSGTSYYNKNIFRDNEPIEGNSAGINEKILNV